jgi:hypothetical protein
MTYPTTQPTMANALTPPATPRPADSWNLEKAADIVDTWRGPFNGEGDPELHALSGRLRALAKLVDGLSVEEITRRLMRHVPG